MKQKIINVFIIFSVLILFVGFSFLYYQLYNLPQKENVGTTLQEPFVQEVKEEIVSGNDTEEDYLTSEEIDEKISLALTGIPEATKTVVYQVTPKASKNVTYISLGNTFSTISTDWVDVPGSSIYVAVETDYGADAKVSWEASLKVAHPGGKVFVRLFDDTNKIAVDFSEIESEANSYEQLSTGFLPFWKGRNLYKVQIKSLNSFEAFYTGGKIKVAY
jgi:hypothetical protein